MFIGVDPGRDKCGVAVLNSEGVVKFSKVISTGELELTLKNLSTKFDVELVILGNGTTHIDAENKIKALNLSVEVIDEKFTTEQARKLYWKKNPPKGWRKFLPTSMQVPPEPVDNLVAEILVLRHLKIGA